NYDTYYEYQVRAVDQGGNTSNWVTLNANGTKPLQGSSSDLAIGSVFGYHIAGTTITGANIAGSTITGTHIAAAEITGTHIAANAVRATHLDITIGGTNWIKNSAFGMQDLSGALAIDWTAIGSPEIMTDVSAPIGDHVAHFVGAAGGIGYSQTLTIASGPAVLSGYLKMQAMTNLLVVLLDDQQVEIESYAFSGSQGYTRFVRSVDLSNYTQVTLKVVAQDATGEAWVTGLKLEPGDLLTPWQPYDGETYGAAGNVQINSSGIQISNGKLKITTGISNSVVIDGTGITATKAAGQSATLDASGLTVIGGAFSLSNNGETLILDAAGLRAYNGGVNTINLASDGTFKVYNGRFTLSSGAVNSTSSRLVLDSSGLHGFNG
ncbi:MAG TPA: hypothetical protein VFK03_00660, partial [Candidatus Saccharimonadales bacterium]|nr:hypothetical protein [Candidatus Saccharimonadales bacterium]